MPQGVQRLPQGYLENIFLKVDSVPTGAEKPQKAQAEAKMELAPEKSS